MGAVRHQVTEVNAGARRRPRQRSRCVQIRHLRQKPPVTQTPKSGAVYGGACDGATVGLVRGEPDLGACAIWLRVTLTSAILRASIFSDRPHQRVSRTNGSVAST